MLKLGSALETLFPSVQLDSKPHNIGEQLEEVNYCSDDCEPSERAGNQVGLSNLSKDR